MRRTYAIHFRVLLAALALLLAGCAGDGAAIQTRDEAGLTSTPATGTSASAGASTALRTTSLVYGDSIVTTLIADGGGGYPSPGAFIGGSVTVAVSDDNCRLEVSVATGDADNHASDDGWYLKTLSLDVGITPLTPGSQGPSPGRFPWKPGASGQPTLVTTDDPQPEQYTFSIPLKGNYPSMNNGYRKDGYNWTGPSGTPQLYVTLHADIGKTPILDPGQQYRAPSIVTVIDVPAQEGYWNPEPSEGSGYHPAVPYVAPHRPVGQFQTLNLYMKDSNILVGSVAFSFSDFDHATGAQNLVVTATTTGNYAVMRSQLFLGPVGSAPPWNKWNKRQWQWNNLNIRPRMQVDTYTIPLSDFNAGVASDGAGTNSFTFAYYGDIGKYKDKRGNVYSRNGHHSGIATAWLGSNRYKLLKKDGKPEKWKSYARLTTPAGIAEQLAQPEDWDIWPVTGEYHEPVPAVTHEETNPGQPYIAPTYGPEQTAGAWGLDDDGNDVPKDEYGWFDNLYNVHDHWGWTFSFPN